ncbi:MAG: hypothetical protein GY708_27090 [Actinomycetia bacterium]|nr:hypothetical protein [Actinomycetes bacterium]
MIAGMILATVGLGLTAIATLRLTGDLPAPLAAVVRSDGTTEYRRRPMRVSGSVAMVCGIAVQILGAAVATLALSEAGVMMTVALSWVVVGAGVLSLRVL